MSYKPKPLMLVAYIDASNEDEKFLDPFAVVKKVQEILNSQLDEFVMIDPSSNKEIKINCISNVEKMEY